MLAVNADSPSAVTDVLEAALRTDAPVIVETSLWQLTGRSFGNGDPLLGLARYLVQIELLARSARYAAVPVAFHTDHIKGPSTLEILTAAILGSAGFRASSVSLDSSSMMEAENLATAAKLCEVARSVDAPLTLEMEAGVDDGLTPLDETDRVVGGIDSLHPGVLALWAPGCGTRHGLHAGGFPSFSADHVRIQAERASSICGRPIGIALHGSSGLPEAELRAAVSAGVVKVNWSSESLLLRSTCAQEFYAAQRLVPTEPGFKEAAMDNGVQSYIAVRYVPAVAERIQLLGGAGMGARFRNS